MTDVRSSGQANEILDQVAVWIERRDRDDWTTADQLALDTWLAETPANLVAFLRADNAWRRADRLNALRTQLPHMRSTGADTARRPFPAAFRTVALLAAVCVLGAATLTYQTRPSDEVYSTPIGGHTILSLADGSKVELNTDTILRVGTSGARRTVKLEKGEALFDVRHDAVHPFVVLAANHRVTDLGTKFVVRRSKNRVEVTLIEGSAQIANIAAGEKSNSAVLTKGDVAIATSNTLSVERQSEASVTRALAWRRGVVVFDNMTLAKAAEEFNRYNTHKLSVADPSVAKMTVVGTFHTDDVKGFAEVAQDVLHLHAETSGNQTVLSR